MNLDALRHPALMVTLVLLGSVVVASIVVSASIAKAASPAFGRFLSSECVTCHQISGAHENGIPSIVGWPRAQFIAVLNSYRAKERDSDVMQSIAARLSDDEIAALAAYFETIEKK